MEHQQNAILVQWIYLLVSRQRYTYVPNMLCDSLGIKHFFTTGREVVPGNHMSNENNPGCLGMFRVYRGLYYVGVLKEPLIIRIRTEPGIKQPVFHGK